MWTSKSKPERLVRRRLLIAAGAFPFLFTSSAYANTQVSDPIIQPALPGEEAFIERTFEMQRLAVSYGDQGYGAIIVRDNVIIGQSWSQVIIDQDPTAHAEMAAIRDAARRTKSRRLNNAVMYSSSRPCPMCEAASYWAGIEQMIHGRNASDAGSPHLCG
jgi:tRNA(Arg) A34 adenosine deaminase TadA